MRAVLRLAEMSEREAVRALRRCGVRTAQSTLDHIIGGGQSRCRASLRTGLASLLGVPLPPEWLGGDSEAVWEGNATGRAIAERRKKLGRPARGLLGLEGEPPLSALLAYRLRREVERAWPQATANEVRRLVRRLLSLTMWRRWLFQEPHDERIAPEETDRFSAAVAEALHIALRPWLAGQSAIPEARLRRMQRALDRMSDMAFPAP